MVGPRLLRDDGTLDHAAKRSFPTPLSALGHFSGLGRRPGARGQLAAYRAPEVESGPVDAVNGAFMLMRREALEQLGRLRRGLLDVHGGPRPLLPARAGGLGDRYEPGATVTHVKGGHHRRRALTAARLGTSTAGMYRFYRDHYAADAPAA